MAHSIHAVIMAGGSGKRFWPRSRRALPKQFLALGGGASLLRETFLRVAPLAGPGGVVVITGAEHVERVRKELPELPADHTIGEPVGRDTAACIGLAAEWIAARGAGDEALMLVCPSDHRIAPVERFQEAVRRAADLALAGLALAGLAGSGGELVTFGIRPRGPSSAFGYIERGEPAGPPAPAGAGSFQAYRARRFLEKPERSRAEELLRSGGFYWNSGVFVFSVGAIRRAIARFLPELAKGLEPVGRRLLEGRPPLEALAEAYPRLPRTSIDRGVLEKAAPEGQVVVMEAPFEWDDVGSWNSLERSIPPDGEGNHVEGRHVGLDTRGCIIAGTGRRLIATIGLRDLVLVETDDAILVCPRDQAERVKDLVDRLDSGGEGDRT